MWAFGGLGSLFAFILLLLVSLKTKTQFGVEPYTLLPTSAACLYMAWRSYKSPKPSNKIKVKQENKNDRIDSRRCVDYFFHKKIF